MMTILGREGKLGFWLIMPKYIREQHYMCLVILITFKKHILWHSSKQIASWHMVPFNKFNTKHGKCQFCHLMPSHRGLRHFECKTTEPCQFCHWWLLTHLIPNWHVWRVRKSAIFKKDRQSTMCGLNIQCAIHHALCTKTRLCLC